MQINHFRDLVAYQKAHQLALMIYKITKEFPKEESFGLISQMRRAAISVTSNIAEGFSRNSAKDKMQFYCIAKGSLTELESQCMVARDLSYINGIDYTEVGNQISEVGRLITGLQKFFK